MNLKYELQDRKGKWLLWMAFILSICMGINNKSIWGYLFYPAIMPSYEQQTNDNQKWMVSFLTWSSPLLTYERLYGKENTDYIQGMNTDYLFGDPAADNTANETAMETTDPVDVTESVITASSDTVQVLEEMSPTVPSVTKSLTATDLTVQPLYTRNQLADFNFLMDHCYTVDSTTYVDANEMNADTLLAMDMSIRQDTDDYQILIYHTHSSSETFADSRPGVLEDTPIGLGDTLTSMLEGYGYKVYHDRTVYDQIDGKVDRNYAYTASGEAIDRILAEHPSIEVVIDLHRDGLNPHTHLVTEINGKPTAKIMFFNGVSRTVRNGELDYLYNPNRQANLAFSLQMYLTGEAMYDDYLRNIYIKGYQYNLDRRPKATLIEVGGQTNTVEEANNAMEPLAEILHRVLSGERAWE